MSAQRMPVLAAAARQPPTCSVEREITHLYTSTYDLRVYRYVWLPAASVGCGAWLIEQRSISDFLLLPALLLAVASFYEH